MSEHDDLEALMEQHIRAVEAQWNSEVSEREAGQEGAEVLDLGHNHRALLTTLHTKPGYWGAIIEHLTPEGEPCDGAISWNEADRVHWELISLHPLTVSPSLLCHRCKDHGFIREGKWIPA